MRERERDKGNRLLMMEKGPKERKRRINGGKRLLMKEKGCGYKRKEKESI